MIFSKSICPWRGDVSDGDSRRTWVIMWNSLGMADTYSQQAVMGMSYIVLVLLLYRRFKDIKTKGG
jgi:hypothetical protein